MLFKVYSVLTWLLGDEMTIKDDEEAVGLPSDDDEGQPIAGPSRHRDAYDPDDDVATNDEMDEDVDLEGIPAGFDDDEGYLGD